MYSLTISIGKCLKYGFPYVDKYEKDASIETLGCVALTELFIWIAFYLLFVK